MEHESIESKKYTKKLHNLLLRTLHYDVEDPLFKRITINYLKLNRTRTSATVYLDLASINDPKRKSLILKKINKLNWLFKNALKPHLDKYRIPYFRFLEDKVFERGQKVEALIKSDIEHGTGG